MSESKSHVTDSEVNLPPVVPPLALSALDDVTDDEAFASTRRENPQDVTTDGDSGLPDEASTARYSDPRRVKGEKLFERRRKKKMKSTTDIGSDEEEAELRMRRKTRVSTVDIRTVRAS